MDSIATIIADNSRLLRRSFDARVRPIGVTRPQWQVLTVLRRHEGINQGGLAEHLDVEPITVCRMVDRLQDANLVERRADPADRRSWRLFLTERAHQLLTQLRPIADELLEEALEGLSVEEVEALSQMLMRIRENLSRRPTEAIVAHG